MAAGTDAFLQSWNGLHDYAYPPFALFRFDHRGVVPGAPEPCSVSSGHPSSRSQSAPTASFTLSSPEPPCAAASCMVTVQRFARNLDLSQAVSHQLSLCRRSSSHRLYQHRCEGYSRRCSVHRHSISNPTVTKIADFLCFWVWRRRSVRLLLLSVDTARPFPQFSVLPAWPSGRLHPQESRLRLRAGASSSPGFSSCMGPCVGSFVSTRSCL